jgi:hypothetical protein
VQGRSWRLLGPSPWSAVWRQAALKLSDPPSELLDELALLRVFGNAQFRELFFNPCEDVEKGLADVAHELPPSTQSK